MSLVGDFIVETHKVEENWAAAVMTLLSPVNCNLTSNLQLESRLEFQRVGTVFRNRKCRYPSLKWETIVVKLDCPVLAVSVWERFNSSWCSCTLRPLGSRVGLPG